MKEYIQNKRARKKGKGKGSKQSSSFHNNNNNNNNNNRGEMNLPPVDFEVVFKWLPIEAVRISPEANRAVYNEYCQQRERMLKETVYNPDGTENAEGIARLRQAGLSDKDIYETIGEKGQTPNGFNYHHLFPRAISGAFNEGPVQFGNETLTSIHDWRCMMVLSCPVNRDIHHNVHDAMDSRNGPIPEREGTRMTYYVAMPLTAEEYELYKTNPKALKEELLIVNKDGFRTVDQRENGTAKNKTNQQDKGKNKDKTDRRNTKQDAKQNKSLDAADIAKIKTFKYSR